MSIKPSLQGKGRPLNIKQKEGDDGEEEKASKSKRKRGRGGKSGIRSEGRGEAEVGKVG